MRNRIVFLLGLGVAITMALLTGGRFLYLIAVSMMLVYVGSWLILKINARNLFLFFNVSGEVLSVGDSIRIEYKLSNMRMLPVAYGRMAFHVSRRLGDMEFPSETAYFGPYQMISIRKDVVCKNRGYYDVGRLDVLLKDPLGLFEHHMSFDKAIDLTVYPTVHPIERYDLPSREFFGRVSVPFTTHEDYTSLKKIRPFNEGDNLKKVHWKLSGKMDQLMVKEFELAASTKVYILVDGYKETIGMKEMNIQDGLAEIAVSLSHYFLMRQIEVSMLLGTHNRSKLDGKDMGQFTMFLEELTGYAPDGLLPYPKFVHSEASKLYYGSTIINVTDKLTEPLFQTLLGLLDKRTDAQVILFGSETEPGEEERIAYLNSKGVRTVRIPERSMISQLLEATYAQAN